MGETMSSKKIFTSISIEKEVFDRVDLDAKADRRPRSFIVEKILRDYYQLPWKLKGEGVCRQNLNAGPLIFLRNYMK